jgi:uncharacterized protein (TIGR00299 family) protein
MKIAYFDCFSGISGDMIIGSLLDAGLDFKLFESEILKLNFKGYRLLSEKVMRNGISGTKFSVEVTENHPHRTFRDIADIITGSSLDENIRKKIISIFKRIAEAEGKIHGVSPEEVHFHEIGAVDSIIDIAGAVIGLQLLGIEKIYSSKINTGSGFVNSMHGKIPVPAPATVELLRGIPVFDSGIKFELTTPTGAGIISVLCSDFYMPDMIFSNTGYGAGSRELEVPNLLRIITGEIKADSIMEPVSVLETNIDDLNPQVYEYAMNRLLSAGALDVFIIPCIMKKSRPGSILKVICETGTEKKLAGIIARETTTSGIRISIENRFRYNRRFEKVETPFGMINIKIIYDGDEILTANPEFEDCVKSAGEYDVPVKKVIDSAKESFSKTLNV